MKKMMRNAVGGLLMLGILLSAGCGRVQQTSAAADRVEVRNNGTAIQWKYSDETDWRDLAALTELYGADGKDGTDGKDGINGADGKDGANGIDGKDGANGADGKDGTNGIDGKDGTNGIDGKDGINGIDGKDGTNGIDGKDGTNGVDGKDGTNGVDGKDGTNGIDGKDGINGADGKDGADGKTVEVQKTDSHIQWRYEGEEWQNLVALADIEGPAGRDGENGENGKTPEFRVNENKLEWRYIGDTVWLNLYDLSALKGADGINGADGRDGADGKTPFVGENGNWWIGTTDTGVKAEGANGANGVDGADGRQIEIQKTDLYIQWRYEGEEWQNLVALADIEGLAGQNGENGENGKTPEFRVNENMLEWRYIGDTVWHDIYDLSVLKGTDGRDGTNGKDGADGKDGQKGADGKNGVDGKDGKDGSCAGYFAASGTVYGWGTLPFTVKKSDGNLISYSSSEKKITLSKGHSYSIVFSGTVSVSAKSDDKICGVSLVDGYNNSEMLLGTRTSVVIPKANQTARLTVAYNNIYTADEDINLTLQFSNMMFQDTNFGDGYYNITVTALD